MISPQVVKPVSHWSIRLSLLALIQSLYLLGILIPHKFIAMLQATFSPMTLFVGARAMRCFIPEDRRHWEVFYLFSLRRFCRVSLVVWCLHVSYLSYGARIADRGNTALVRRHP